METIKLTRAQQRLARQHLTGIKFNRREYYAVIFHENGNVSGRNREGRWVHVGTHADAWHAVSSYYAAYGKVA